MSLKEGSQSSRRRFIAQAAGAAVAAALPNTAYSGNKAGKRRPPNVLFIMSDDMRVELGSYNSRFHAQTPNLDALAHRGVRFRSKLLSVSPCVILHEHLCSMVERPTLQACWGTERISG